MADKPNENGDVIFEDHVSLIKRLNEKFGHHLDKPRDPWPILKQSTGVKPGEMLIFTGRPSTTPMLKQMWLYRREYQSMQHFFDCYGMDAKKARKLIGIDWGVGKDETALIIQEPDGGAKIVNSKLMEQLAKDIKQITDEIYAGLKVPKDLLIGVPTREQIEQARHANTNKEADMTFPSGPSKETLEEIGEAMTKMARANPMPPPKRAVIWEAECLPCRNGSELPLETVRRCHTVVHVLKSRVLAPDSWLNLTPHEVQVGRPYGFEQPTATAPTEPPPAPEPRAKLLEQLCEAATGCKPDGYATWEGVVGFAVTRLNEQNARIKELLLTVSRFERDYNMERQRANRAADEAGTAINRACTQKTADSVFIASLTRELAQLKREMKKR